MVIHQLIYSLDDHCVGVALTLHLKVVSLRLRSVLCAIRLLGRYQATAQLIEYVRDSIDG